jgi:hypothetical protein
VFESEVELGELLGLHPHREEDETVAFLLHFELRRRRKYDDSESIGSGICLKCVELFSNFSLEAL